MTHYKVVRVQDVPDQAPNFGLAPDYEIRAQVKAGDDVVDLEPWTSVRAPPDTIRSIKRAGGS